MQLRMKRFKVFYADESKEILTKKELAEKIASYGFKMGRSIEGNLWTGCIFILSYKMV